MLTSKIITDVNKFCKANNKTRGNSHGQFVKHGLFQTRAGRCLAIQRDALPWQHSKILRRRNLVVALSDNIVRSSL